MHKILALSTITGFLFLLTSITSIAFEDKKIDAKNFDDVITFSKSLSNTVVVTRGEKGAVAVNGDEIVECGVFKGANCRFICDYLKTIKGTVNILIKLIIAVSETDKATSPFANFVKTFDVTPPGAEAIIIKPKAISIDSLKTKIIR